MRRIHLSSLDQSIIYIHFSYFKQSLKLHILREAMEAVAVLIIVPLSGWEKDLALMGRRPGIISWSLLLRNATGILRNVSSAGHEARTTIRFRIEGWL